MVFLEHKKLYRLVKGDIGDGDYTVPIGKANVVRSGDDLTVATYGIMLHYALEAAQSLGRDGIEAEVVGLRSLAPMDIPTILKSVEKTGKVMIVHEDNLTLGLGAEIAARVGQEAFQSLDAPIVRVASPDVPSMPYAPTMEDFCLPDTARIETAMRELAAH